MTPTNDAPVTVEQCVMVCPQCEGEGGYADGLDDAACHTDCTRCGGNGWIVDLAALASAPAGDGVRERAAMRTIYNTASNPSRTKADMETALSMIASIAEKHLARPRSAVAPAGDGVEALLRRSRATIAAMVPPDERDGITRRLLGDLAAALARPRAAALLQQLADENALSDPIEDMPFAERGAVIDRLRRMIADRPRAAVGERGAQALLVFAACARDLEGTEYTERTPDDEYAKFRLLASDYRRAYDAYVALTGKLPPFPDEAHAALQSPPAKVDK